MTYYFRTDGRKEFLKELKKSCTESIRMKEKGSEKTWLRKNYLYTPGANKIKVWTELLDGTESMASCIFV